MKVGIITQPLYTNYGGLLQNYALQQVLMWLGHEVVTIDQNNTKPKKWRIYVSCLKKFLVNLMKKDSKHQYPYVLNKKQDIYIKQYTDTFINKYIKHSNKLDNIKEFSAFVKENNLEALIVGSDQVWRPKYNRNVLHSFFDFAVNFDIKRIAYAASFGVDEWEYTDKQTLKCKKLIKLFDAISVREKSGIKLCEEYLTSKSVCVLDPTMLLDADDYIKLVNLENEPKPDGNLFTYILDKTDLKAKIIEEVAFKLSLKPFSVMPEKVNTTTIKNIDSCVYPSPTKWLRSFIDAKFVVCDSFHGAVFSIIFNKPFIVIGNTRRGLTRFTSLLEMFSLERRLIRTISDLSVIDEPINWEHVNMIRKEMTVFSLSFLTSNLKK